MAARAFDDIVVIGGGCYGSFYTRQLARARHRGAMTFRRLLVVDRDAACQIAEGPPGPHDLVVAEWGSFLDDYLPTVGGGSNLIVPSPLMPHLFLEWLVRRVRDAFPGREVRTAPLAQSLRTPYETVAPDGTHYVSHADWLCPTHCIEPLTCPVTRGLRTWDMAETVAAAARSHAIVFECRHVAYGVGAVPTEQVLSGATRLIDAGNAPFDAVVATVSGCHGAVTGLHLGPWG